MNLHPQIEASCNKLYRSAYNDITTSSYSPNDFKYGKEWDGVNLVTDYYPLLPSAAHIISIFLDIFNLSLWGTGRRTRKKDITEVL